MTLETTDYEQVIKALAERNARLERELTAANLRLLAAETERDVAQDQNQTLVERAQGKTIELSQDLRHQAMQATMTMRIAASVLNQNRNRGLAASLVQRADLVVKALKCSAPPKEKKT